MSIKKARGTIRDAFKKDPAFRRAYVENIACLIMDRMPSFKKNKEKRDAIASDILKLIFD